MPYIKDSFSILAECAAIDLPDTQRVVRESEVREGYNDIEEAAGNYAISAEMVPVVQIENEFYTEAQLLAPFMRDAGIKSIAEALDAVAEANKLEPKAVGLLIESECAVSSMIEKACKKESSKIKDAVMDKVNKATDLAKDLKSKGFKVKRKANKVNEAASDTVKAKDLKKGMVTSTGKITSIERNWLNGKEVILVGYGSNGRYSEDTFPLDKDVKVFDEG